MRPGYIHGLAFATCLALLLLAHFGQLELARYQAEQRNYPYSHLARALDLQVRREICDEELSRKRYVCARVLDRFRGEINSLWKEQRAKEPKFALLSLGPIELKVSPPVKPARVFDSTSWSWEQAYGLVQRIQNEPDRAEDTERWRDFDTMVKFLLEKDYQRIGLGKKFLPPALTPHLFRPNASVRRVSEREFVVPLVAGDFAGQEQKIARVLEPEWSSARYRVRIEWVPAGAYTLRAHRDSARSFVNHAKRTVEIAHLTWTKTLAHELGHVLGFDDHYYNAWHARNCYYTQESRLGDLMSNSEQGSINPEHWEILEKAYPFRRPPAREAFIYYYEK